MRNKKVIRSYEPQDETGVVALWDRVFPSDPEELIRAARGGGVIVSSSRAINYAGNGPDFKDNVRKIAMETRDTLNDHLYRIANDLRA